MDGHIYSCTLWLSSLTFLPCKLVTHRILYIYPESKSRKSVPFSGFSLAMSVGSITWGYCIHYKVNRAAEKGTHDTTWGKLSVYICSMAACLGARYISFVLFAYYVSTYISILAGIHVIGAYVWICKIKPELKNMARCCVERHMYYILLSIIKFSLFMNLSPNPAEKEVGKQMSCFYLFMHLESLLIALLLAVFTPEQWCWSVAVLVCVIVHSSLLFIYYKYLHPTTSEHNI